MKLLQWSTFAGACILGSAAIGYNFQGKNDAQLAALAGAWGLSVVSAYAEHQGHEPDQMLQMVKGARLDLFEQLLDRRCQQHYESAIEVQALPPASDDAGGIYNWHDAPDDAVGVIISGNGGQGKSSIALYLLGLFTQKEPAHIKVLDPHATINHWHEHDLEVLSDFCAIETELLDAVAELDRRRELSLAELDRLPAFIYVADELGAMSKSFEHPEVVSLALSRLGCEGRKYNLSLIVVSHSRNVDKLGIDSNERDNFLLICLGGSARQLAIKQWGKKSPESQHCKNAAYPCVVGGSVPEVLAIHPTHGHHTKYKKTGNKPSGLLPINQINKPPETDSNFRDNGSLPNINQWRSYLENLPTLDIDPTPSQGENAGENFSPPSESENDSENPETQSDTAFSPFPKPDHNPSDGCVRGGNFDRSESENAFTLDEAGTVLSLRKAGKTKPQIITDVWGVKPGKSRKYEAAKEKYEAIQNYWEQLNLWE